MDPERKAAEIEAAWALREQPSRLNGSWRPSVLLRLAEAQNWRCCYCGQRMDGIGHGRGAPTLEHIRPKSDGGGDDDDNLAVACRNCNELRGCIYRAEHIEVLGFELGSS